MTPEEIIDSLWGSLTPGQYDITPDEERGRLFVVEGIEAERLQVRANNNSVIAIRKESFIEAVRYLQDNGHSVGNPCRIGSSNTDGNSLQLCLATKQHSCGTRVINYIASLLGRFGIAIVGHDRPNTIWLTSEYCVS